MAKVRSARGELVDFDLLKIKGQLAQGKTLVDVKAKSNFLDKRLSKKVLKTKAINKGTTDKPVEIKPVETGTVPNNVPKGGATVEGLINENKEIDKK